MCCPEELVVLRIRGEDQCSNVYCFSFFKVLCSLSFVTLTRPELCLVRCFGNWLLSFSFLHAIYQLFLTHLPFPMLLLSVQEHNLMFLIPSHQSDLDTLELAVYWLIRSQIFEVANTIKSSLQSGTGPCFHCGSSGQFQNGKDISWE